VALGTISTDERLRAGEYQCADAFEGKQQAERVAHSGIVIDRVDRAVPIAHTLVSAIRLTRDASAYCKAVRLRWLRSRDKLEHALVLSF
jgi:hypothetical protein